LCGGLAGRGSARVEGVGGEAGAFFVGGRMITHFFA
jgi:hypothetical protein